MTLLKKLSAFLLLTTLTGCAAGGAGTSTTSTPTTPTTPTTPAPVTTVYKAKFAYATNQGSGGGIGTSISGYSVDTTTGALTPLNGFPLQTGNEFLALTRDPQNRFLLAADVSLNQLDVFDIDSTSGALTRFSIALTSTSLRQPIALAIDSTGTHVYMVGQASNTVGAYTLGSNGTLTPISGQPFATVGQPFVTGSTSASVNVAINSAGTTVYVRDVLNVYVFHVTAATGALSLVQIVPLSGAYGNMALDPSGAYLYTSDQTHSSLTTYSADSTSGQLTLLNTISAKFGAAKSITISPTGLFAFTIETTDATSFNVSNYRLESYSIAKGVLTSAGEVQGIFGLNIAVDPAGSFVYAPLTCSQPCTQLAPMQTNIIYGYSIGVTGTLTAVPGSPVAAGLTPWGITVTNQ